MPRFSSRTVPGYVLAAVVYIAFAGARAAGKRLVGVAGIAVAVVDGYRLTADGCFLRFSAAGAAEFRAVHKGRAALTAKSGHDDLSFIVNLCP